MGTRAETGPDVAIVGTGPNGLAAGVIMARAGLSVRLYEAADEIGGGSRSADLFDSGVVHDICSAVHPMAAASRFFREFDLAARGVELLHPEASYAHPLDGADAGIAYRSLDRTCERLGRDGARWRRLMGPLVRRSSHLVDLLLSNQRQVPLDLLTPLLLGSRVLAHGTPLASRMFREPQAAAMFAGVAAHAVQGLPSLPGGAVGLLLGHLAHSSGWPVPRGGSGRIAEVLAEDIRAHGGTLHTGTPITDIRELGGARTVLLDVAPRGFSALAGEVLPERYRRRLDGFQYASGAAKVDFLVSEPIPWRDPEVGRAGTVHIGGTQREIWRSETAAAGGVRPDEPFVLLADPMAADPSRGLPGKRPVWAYCHVPNGDTVDPTELVRAQIERHAPGFGDTIIASRAVSTDKMEAYNPNYVGGDISAGAMSLTQAAFRPAPALDPHRTPLAGVYLCSASSVPGPGVHGMCGYYAARSALRREFGIRELPALGPRGRTADAGARGIR
ncbi:dehydrogenase [Amycolatopsis antarctica]|uniref:Dehydrogenase n=1 Tax=Amycolatopsis antarctica TaxID=1854586 RepID=A0A263D5N3_9PSEU|nr:NAD(P)/FAD-dependent oxidoreductase [Amycolatopsis antarctica]OZM73814.1 dehydrogenase [Amycolatopsis antarctica]